MSILEGELASQLPKGKWVPRKRDSPHIQSHPTVCQFNIHKNNYKSHENIHKIKHKRGRVWAPCWAEAVVYTQGINPWIHPPQSHKVPTTSIETTISHCRCSPLPLRREVRMYKLPIKERKLDKLELGRSQQRDWSLGHCNYPPLSTSNQCTFILGDETKHKGTTKLFQYLAPFSLWKGLLKTLLN